MTHFSPQPKPPKRSTVQRKKHAQRAATVKDVRAMVFERDSHCRIPWCCSPFYGELAHLKAKGMGGNPAGSRTTTANTARLCREHHQGLRSIHSGHIRWLFLSDKGADGPMAWSLFEALPKAEL